MRYGPNSAVWCVVPPHADDAAPHPTRPLRGLTFGVWLLPIGGRKMWVGLAVPDPGPDPGRAVALQRERSLHDRQEWWKSGSATTTAVRARSRRFSCRQRR